MSTPSTAITRLDLSLSYGEFDAIANEENFICLKVLPPLGVSQEAADFSKVDLANLLNPKYIQTARAPRGSYQRNTHTFTKDNYATQEHGLEEVVDDAEVEKWGDLINIEQQARTNLVQNILVPLEYETAAAVFDTATWTGASLTTAVSAPWSTKASGDPISDIDGARAKVQNNCGQTPNAAIMSDLCFTKMIRTDRIENLLKGNSITAPILMNAAMQPGLSTNPEFMGTLCSLLRLEKIIVGRGFYNSADKGQTATMASFWSDTMCMVAVIRDDGINGNLQSPKPQLGRTLFCTKNGEPVPGAGGSAEDSLIIEEYREENVRGSVLRVRNKRVIKILQANCGHLLTAVTA